MAWHRVFAFDVLKCSDDDDPFPPFFLSVTKPHNNKTSANHYTTSKYQHHVKLITTSKTFFKFFFKYMIYSGKVSLDSRHYEKSRLDSTHSRLTTDSLSSDPELDVTRNSLMTHA